MSPLEQLQSDVEAKLKSEGLLAAINVKSLRKMRIASELDLALVYGTPRATGGKVGIGIIVGMHSLDVEHPNTPGPLLSVILPVRVYEHPMINMDATIGTGQTAEDILKLVLKCLHQFRIEGLAALFAGRDAAKPVDSGNEGVLCYEAQLRCQLAQETIMRVTLPTIDETNLIVTLTALEDNVAIYYTIGKNPGSGDELTKGASPSIPASDFPGSGNPAAILYSAPFAVAVGQTIRWAGYSYNANWQGSDIGFALVNLGALAAEQDGQPYITGPEGGKTLVQ